MTCKEKYITLNILLQLSFVVSFIGCSITHCSASDINASIFASTNVDDFAVGYLMLLI